MTDHPHEHTSDEFGRQTSSSLTGLDAPMIGAASSIVVDGIVERESGVTPPPPPVKLWVLAVALVAMFILGVVLITVVFRFVPPPPIEEWMSGSLSGM